MRSIGMEIEMGHRNWHKPVQRVDDLCHRASDMLKAAGFLFHGSSMKTEACYYRYPGKKSLLRVARHRKDRTPSGLDHVAGRVTFNGNVLTGPDEMRIADEKVTAMVAMAIGQYFLNAKSSSGRTLDFDSGNPGSNPGLATNAKRPPPS